MAEVYMGIGAVIGLIIAIGAEISDHRNKCGNDLRLLAHLWMIPLSMVIWPLFIGLALVWACAEWRCAFPRKG